METLLGIVLWLAAIGLTIKGLIAAWAFSAVVSLLLLFFAAPILTVVGFLSCF